MLPKSITLKSSFNKSYVRYCKTHNFFRSRHCVLFVVLGHIWSNIVLKTLYPGQEMSYKIFSLCLYVYQDLIWYHSNWNIASEMTISSRACTLFYPVIFYWCILCTFLCSFVFLYFLNLISYVVIDVIVWSIVHFAKHFEVLWSAL